MTSPHDIALFEMRQTNLKPSLSGTTQSHHRSDSLPVIEAIHMLLTMLTALAAGPPARREWQMALQTLPASVAGGAAVLLHNVALTQVGVGDE